MICAPISCVPFYSLLNNCVNGFVIYIILLFISIIITTTIVIVLYYYVCDKESRVYVSQSVHSMLPILAYSCGQKY